MQNRYVRTLISSAASIVPVVIIIILLSLLNLAPLGGWDYLLLGIGTIILIAGMFLFSLGADQGLTKVGEYMGASLSRRKNLWVIIVFAFLLGALITVAEPSILIIAEDVSIPTWVLIGSIAVGVGIFVAIGILRIIYHKSLKIWLLFFYAIVFMLVCLVDNGSYLPFIFDSGGITTGSATVPFILALSMGVATVRGGNANKEDTFGLVGIASIGPILTMLILIIFNESSFTEYIYEKTALMTSAGDVGNSFIAALLPSSSSSLGALIEVAMAVLPILIIFLIYEAVFIKLSHKQLGRLFIGFLFTYVGLVLFLAGVEGAMSPVGKYIGESLASNLDWIIIVIAFVIGLVTILCEPAVQVLTTQISEISDGTIRKRTVLIAISIATGIAIALSAVRALYGFSIMWYIVPGYMLALILMFFCDNTYTAIAFDSGGTASGPMSVSFILPMLTGLVYERSEGSGDIYYSAFGVIGLIALMPILTIEILGVREKARERIEINRTRKELALYEGSEEIIHF